MITAASLRSHTSKDLAQIAKKKGVPGWHSMRKEDLVKAILKLSKSKSGNGKTTNGKVAKSERAKSNGSISKNLTKSKTSNKRTTRKPTKKVAAPNPRVVKIIREQNRARQRQKDLAQHYIEGEPIKDGIVLIVRDAYWLQACWSITPKTVHRCEVALAEHWHNAKPVIRLLAVKDKGSTHGYEETVRDIPIHGGVRNWYIDVNDPPSDFRVALGYLTENGRFHLIAKSNIVSTPFPGKSDSMKGHWEDIAENHQKYFALSGGYSEGKATEELRNVFEEQLQRPMSSPSLGHVSSANHFGNLEFQVDAELVVFGSVDPKATVTLGGEPVQIQPDGSFKVEMSMPDRRQVLPVVACSRDGSQQRTTVLAIEKNTKVMEAVNCDPEEG